MPISIRGSGISSQTGITKRVTASSLAKQDYSVRKALKDKFGGSTQAVVSGTRRMVAKNALHNATSTALEREMTRNLGVKSSEAEKFIRSIAGKAGQEGKTLSNSEKFRQFKRNLETHHLIFANNETYGRMFKEHGDKDAAIQIQDVRRAYEKMKLRNLAMRKRADSKEQNIADSKTSLFSQQAKTATASTQKSTGFAVASDSGGVASIATNMQSQIADNYNSEEHKDVLPKGA